MKLPKPPFTMKAILFGFFIILTLAACKHSAKDPDNSIAPLQETPKDEISKEVVSDRHGEEMEIITNKTKNTVTVHLNGKTYELKKNRETPEFSTEDNQYQYTETKNEVTFLKKDIDMVLFHSKKNQASSKMASQ